VHNHLAPTRISASSWCASLTVDAAQQLLLEGHVVEGLEHVHDLGLEDQAFGANSDSRFAATGTGRRCCCEATQLVNKCGQIMRTSQDLAMRQ